MAKEAAKTGIAPTTIVAVEQYFPEDERIIKDDFAFKMHPSALRWIVSLARCSWFRGWMIKTMDKNFPGLYAGTLCRKRYIDEKLLDSSNQITQIVNLGAGFDTRAMRLPGHSEKYFWEIDQQENIRSKQKKLIEILRAVPSNMELVSIDFDKEQLWPILKLHHCSTPLKAFFILEAVTQYLTEDGIKSTFNFLANVASGSKLTLTYVRKDFIDGKEKYNWEKIYKRYIQDKKIWLFGMEVGAWPDFMKKYGWQIIEDIGYDDLSKKYIEPTGRVLATTPVERIIYAEKL